MQLLDNYITLQKQIFEYFGYEENWCVLPIDVATDYYWRLDGEGPGTVYFADTVEDLEDKDESGNYYSNEIYTQRHLPKWVYRGKDYTMIVVDTQTDGNKLLSIFDNSKEIKPENAIPNFQFI